jgi:hypothetical protein
VGWCKPGRRGSSGARIEQVLGLCGNNPKEAADRLAVSLATVYRAA